MSNHYQGGAVLVVWGLVHVSGVSTACILAVEEHSEFWSALTTIVGVLAASLPGVIASLLALARTKRNQLRMNQLRHDEYERTYEVQQASRQLAECQETLRLALKALADRPVPPEAKKGEP
jgi:mannitol-specific phosphotransferase system IIBC component